MRILMTVPTLCPVIQLVSISDGTRAQVLVLEIHACHHFPSYTQMTVLVHHSGLFLRVWFGLTIFHNLFGESN